MSDDEDIEDVQQETKLDPWQLIPFAKGDMKNSLVDESSFSLLAPRELLPEIAANFPSMESALKNLGVQVKLTDQKLEVMTTKDTWDPYAIIKARDLVRLVARGMKLEVALKVLQDGVESDIVDLAPFNKKGPTFGKRVQRMLGPNGATQKAIEILTGTNIAIYHYTVAIVGGFAGIEKVRKLVLDNMRRNIHPVYGIKELMSRRELAKDPTKSGTDWKPFIPVYGKTKPPQKQKKPKPKPKKKKPYSPFPNAPPPRKIDLMMASGEYLLTEEERNAKKMEEKMVERAEKSHQKRQKQLESFVPPKEEKSYNTKANKEPTKVEDTIGKIKSNITTVKAREDQAKGKSKVDVDDYVLKKAKKQKTK